MMTVQRKYKIIKKASLKELSEEVNELIQREYKDREGFIYQSSGRWQCLGGLGTSPMRHYAFFEGDAQPIRPVIHVFDHHAVASLHIGHETLFAIGFPNNGRLHVATHVK